MEYQIKSKISQEHKNIPKNSSIYYPKNIQPEENKNYFQSNTTLNNNSPINNDNFNDTYIPKYNKIISQRNTNLYPIIGGASNPYKENRAKIQNKNFNNTLLINTNKNNYNSNFRTLNRNSSVGTMLNKNIRKINPFKGLNRNKSTAQLLNEKTLYILPLIKPRKIIIDYCCGPYELHVTDINKKNLNCKKFGYNTFFMGDRFNPNNYEIKQPNRLSRNYYGKLFAN